MTFLELLGKMKGTRAVVLGDLMLDEYIFGQATRISQEAPVMVVRQNKTHAVPGGAANVAKNLTALGASTQVIGVVGEDEAGRQLAEALAAEGSSDSLVIRDPSRPTTRKTRVLADSAHQVLRIDHEETKPISGEIEERLLLALHGAIRGAQVLLLSDYQKGTITEHIAAHAVRVAGSEGVPVVANAKPASISWYRNADLVSLNRSEALAATPDPSATPQEIARSLQTEHGIQHVLVTLGSEGMVTPDFHIAPEKVDVFDTAGAGDTAIATAALGLAVAGYLPTVFELAAKTSAAVVRKVGVAVPSEDDLAQIAKSGV